MTRKTIAHIIFMVGAVLLPGLVSGEGRLQVPWLPPPDRYGDVTIERVTKEKNVAPVNFSHWVHRVKYTCRVCHYELEFNMKANATPITCNNGQMDGGFMNGRFCGACHNGKTSFGPREGAMENCSTCHSGDAGSSWKKFSDLREKLPKSKFGNEINWTKALEEGFIEPKDSLSDGKREIVNIQTLTLRAEMTGISSAIFPHKTHEQWLDCSSCHPELFNIKKKTTESLRMSNMLRGESCGVCHLSVAFPLNDCNTCHPKMKVF